MNRLGWLLTLVATHGYWFVLASLVATFCVRDSHKRRRLVAVLLIVGGIIVGSIFLAGAYGKLKPLPGLDWSWASIRTSMAFFAMQVESYQILSSQAANAVAHLLPFAELILGLWLVSGIGRRFSGIVASLALCGFMIAITSAYLRGLKIDCGCGVGPPEQAGPAALLRDGLKFLMPAVLVTIGSFWIHRQSRAASLPASAPSA
jgi:uncharacterized membrane protein YphA (DoxX/SURF4 family)